MLDGPHSVIVTGGLYLILVTHHPWNRRLLVNHLSSRRTPRLLSHDKVILVENNRVELILYWYRENL